MGIQRKDSRRLILARILNTIHLTFFTLLCGYSPDPLRVKRFPLPRVSLSLSLSGWKLGVEGNRLNRHGFF